MPRYFTLAEAQAVLPEVEDTLKLALVAKADLDRAEASLRGTAERVMFAGGVQLDRGKVLADLKQRQELAARVQQFVESIQATGCLVKDLDLGLLDFPALRQGEEVYLCWKLGEPGIAFWHGIEEGFRGRKPIDESWGGL